jgi:hypothetical protein
MKIGIISVFTDYHRRGKRNRLPMQPGIGPLIAGLLPPNADIEIVNETWRSPDWERDYDLLFISCLHSDFDRARQISHYWRRRGATTVLGGTLASSYPNLCQPYFDSIVVGDPEVCVRALYADFLGKSLKSRYVSTQYDATQVAAPRFDLVSGQSLTPISLEATRGCPFQCDFCVLTGLGTRHHLRPIADVLRDIRHGQAAVARWWMPGRHRIIGFADNNIGGSIAYLRELCAALAPLKLNWYAAATFNIAANRELVRLMSKAGCRVLFVGLESFNPAAIQDMNKKQNVIPKIRSVIENCRDNGILLTSGLMVSPIADDLDYLKAIPDHLEASGLRVPTFMCFETPIPGTPNFRRLASGPKPALLPNALLRDFSGYTLTVRPARAPIDEFVRTYRAVVERVYSPGRRLRKAAGDILQFARGGHLFPALVDALDMIALDPVPDGDRTLLAGTDRPPPEQVPLRDSDFNTSEECSLIMRPWQVTDEHGKALPQWTSAQAVFRRQRPVRAIPGSEAIAVL